MTINISPPADWPPQAQDVWADRDGVEYVTHCWESNDRVMYGMGTLDGKTRMTPGRLLEIKAPLTLVSAGWQRAATA